MISPFTPLSEEEFDELDNFLLNEVDTEEGMTIDMMDGALLNKSIWQAMWPSERGRLQG